LISWRFWVLLGSLAAFGGCGPNPRPQGPCDGPSFNLVVRTETGPLPQDTRINVRYGGNQDGEPYALGDDRTGQAVFCTESAGGAPGGDEPDEAAGAGPAQAREHVPPDSLHCALYTQGPARLDVTATGYVPIEDLALSLDSKHRCRVDFPVTLVPLMDAGM
jgi:hypothetical protein